MNLKRPFVSFAIVFFLFVLFVCFTILIVGTHVFNRENLKYLANEIDIVSYLKNNSNLKTVLEEKRIPDDIFNNIDMISKEKIVNEAIDNIFEHKDKFVDANSILFLIRDSIKIYELRHTVDVYVYIEEDIINFSQKLENNINSMEFIKSFGILSSLFKEFNIYIIMVVSLFLFFLLFKFEKKKAFLVSGLFLVGYSILLYYIHANLLFKGIVPDIVYLSSAFGFLLSGILEKLEKIYIFTFVIGLLFLIIFVCLYMKKIARNIRIYSYDINYRR